MNLFSIFDPCNLSLFRNWFFIFFFVFFFIFYKNIKKTNGVFFKKVIINLIYNDLKILIKKNSYLLIFFCGLFYILLINNFLGLIGYIFSTTSHLRFVLTLSLYLWVAIFLVNLVYNIKNFLSHLVPEEISYALVFLIVLIETLRNIIRPFILGIRLRANIIAGHLLIVLVSTVLSKVCVRFVLVSGGILVLVILETIVRIIQAYIFTILLSLYFSE